MTDIQSTLAALEQRVRALEDQAAIAELIASYGPLVDSGDAERVAALWHDDGIYDVDELLMTGQHEIAAMVRSGNHQGWIAGGCAHFVGPPKVTVNGDTAEAVCYSLMIVHEDAVFRLRRATANRWWLRRTPSGWRVTNRTSRVLDGRAESPALLGGE